MNQNTCLVLTSRLTFAAACPSVTAAPKTAPESHLYVARKFERARHAKPRSRKRTYTYCSAASRCVSILIARRWILPGSPKRNAPSAFPIQRPGNF